MDFEAVIGLEVHAELGTRSKMFCGCPVVDSTKSQPNSAVCPICSGMPGSLPVINRRAVEFGLRVALALECTVLERSIFARKNYFYPDLPKGYQISQYEEPLARSGRLVIRTSKGERTIRIRRVHFEEDTGKLTHIEKEGQSYSLIDLNRAGVPLLEIVSEPDMHTPEEVRRYAETLRSLLRYLGVNSGDMQKGVLRIEPNVSVRLSGSQSFGTRTEIKNLNSFRALEHSVAFEVERQSELLQQGEKILQETRGWDDAHDCTVAQRVKEEADDYRYFPEPDLPPLLITRPQQEQVRNSLPELPEARYRRFQAQYALPDQDIEVLIEEPAVADFFEKTVEIAAGVTPKMVANWTTGDLFSLLNESNLSIVECKISSANLASLLTMLSQGRVNQPSAKLILTEMFVHGKTPQEIVRERGLIQVSDEALIEELVDQVLSSHPDQLKAYLAGKTTIARWFFGQVMRRAEGRANPQVVERILGQKLVSSGFSQTPPIGSDVN
jgi:aspartyl-tRNA(Asn)/glutamyl-tRNA(Gln) amidotransferase subunit B